MKILYFLEAQTPLQRVLLTLAFIASLCFAAFLILTAPNLVMGIVVGLLLLFTITLIVNIFMGIKI